MGLIGGGRVGVGSTFRLGAEVTTLNEESAMGGAWRLPV